MISLTLAKFARSVRKIVTFTTFASEPPAASATALRFSNTRRISASMSPVDHLHGRRIERNLARQIHRVADAHGLRIGADRLRRLVGVDGLSGHRTPLIVDAPAAISVARRCCDRGCAIVRVTLSTSGMRRMTSHDAREVLAIAHLAARTPATSCRRPSLRPRTRSMLVSRAGDRGGHGREHAHACSRRRRGSRS